MNSFDLIEQWALEQGFSCWHCSNEDIHSCRFNAEEYASHLPVINLCGGLTVWRYNDKYHIVKSFKGFPTTAFRLDDPKMFDLLNEAVFKWKRSGGSSAW